MSFSTFFHEPTWTKVYTSAAITACGALGLVALRYRIVLARKRDIYKPAVMIDEIYGTEQPVEPVGNEVQQQPDPSSNRPNSRGGLRRLIRAASITLCLTVMTLASALGLRYYTILNNWQEGNDRTFIGDYVGGIVCYKKALRADTSLKKTHLLIGIALLKSGKGRTAIRELEIAAKGEETDPEAPTVMGDAYMILKRPAEAVKAYKQAISITPDDPDYYVALAAALLPLQRPDEAYIAYQKAIEINPRYVRAHIKIGELLLTLGHLDEAMAHCKHAVELGPNDVAAHNTLGACYARRGQFSEAIEEYKRSVALDPHGAIAYYDLGTLLEQTKDLPHALDTFRHIQKLTPRNGGEFDAVRRAQFQIDHLLQ